MIEFLQGKWLRHPLHPALVHIPTALWPAALVFDVLSRSGEGPFAELAFYSILIGLVAALFAIPTGYADWTDIKPDKPAWKLGLYHMILNLVITVLWGINLVLRVQTYQSEQVVPAGSLALSAIATLLLLVSGYLGGRMIYAYGINVARLSKEKWRKIAVDGGAVVPPEKGE